MAPDAPDEIRVLLIEDSDIDAELLAGQLSKARMAAQITRVFTEQKLAAALRDHKFDVILADFSFPEFDGLTALAMAQASAPDVPFIFVSGVIGEEFAANALRGGATDYVLKRNLSRIGTAVDRALTEARERRERLATEAALRKTDERLQQALSVGQGIGTWDWDVPNDRVFADARFAKLYGVDQEVATAGAPIAAFFRSVHPDDSSRLRESVAAAVASGGEFSDEYRILQRDGVERWVAAQGRCELDADGRALRFPGVTFDITDRKHAELRTQALLDLDDRFRTLDDPAELAFAAAELLGRTLHVSRAGYGTIDPVAESVTIERDWNAPGIKSLAGVLQFRDYGSYIEDLKRGETVVFADADLDPRTADNAAALKAISAQSVVNMPVTEQGGFVALLYLNHATARAWPKAELDFIREVANRTRMAVQRRKAEEDLRDLNADLERMVIERSAEPGTTWQVSPHLLSVIDLNDGTIQRVNPAWRQLGWSEGEITGAHYVSFVHPDDLDASYAAFEQVKAGIPVLEFENRYRTKAGGYEWLSWVAVPERGKLYSTSRLITAEKEKAAELLVAQDALRQAQKMEAVGQLTGGIAHDFNNLLAAMGGSFSLIERRLVDGKPGVERYISSGQDAVRRAASLTQRLLAFSRRQTLDPVPTDVNKLIVGMEELIRRSVGPTVDVEVVGAVGLWPTRIDQSQLESALLNLCINGRDAMAPDGGRLTIETANKWLDERAGRERDLKPGQYISLCVTDTGVGMDADTIARVFDPFFTTKPIGQGTGLGLSMVYGFVRQSGGQVRVYSEIGKGTTMCLYLPRFVGNVEEEAIRETDVLQQAGVGETILVVDDEPTLRMLMTDVLEEAGYHVLQAGTGPDGLRVLQTDVRIDLMVTDVGLPGGVNGRQVADAARVKRPNLNVLFITGYAENAAIGNGHLEAGMEVLTKPFEISALANKVREMLDR